jgi:methionyl aminopeptidase
VLGISQIPTTIYRLSGSNYAYTWPESLTLFVDTIQGFPKSICTSVNETVCHGIPDARALQAGDIVNLDVTVCLDGYHGDLNETYGVGFGEIRAGGTTLEDRKKHAEAEESIKLMRCALGCLQDAIALCKPGTRFRDLGEVIQQRADSDGFGVVKDFCGHGIGTLFHCAPNVPHYAGNKGTAVGAFPKSRTTL